MRKEFVALVAGNDAYPKALLQNSNNDARAVAKLLEKLGFQVSLALDVNLKDTWKKPLIASSLTLDREALGYFTTQGTWNTGGRGELSHSHPSATLKDEADAKYSSYSASRLSGRGKSRRKIEHFRHGRLPK